MPTLNWIGKDKVINHHLDVPFRTLKKEYTFSLDGYDDGNMIIHGDNLEALKSLLPQYEGRIRCIYIDPPYNTGNENWVYNDNVNDPRIQKWLGQVVGKEGEDLSRHDKWLCMMYPRLRLLQKLMSADGVIFISIGEEEIASLSFLCDELFGKHNKITIFGRQMKSGGAKGHYYTPNLDYILVYAKDINQLPYFRAIMTQEQIDTFYKFTETEGPRKGEIYGEERLFKASLDPRANQRYYIQCPDGSFAIPPGTHFPERTEEGLIVKPDDTDKVWKWIYPRYIKEKEAGNIVFKSTSTSGLVDENGNQSKWNIYNKLWLSEQQDKGVVPSNLITNYENRQSAAQLKALGLEFDYAKPVGLVEYLLTISLQGKDSIVLDSFAGSGTTAHAVLNMNKADGGHRKFILVEMGDYADSITAERVRRVIKGYGEEKNATEGTGGSFSFYELGEPLFLPDGMLNPEASLEDIRSYVYFSETHREISDPAKDDPYFLGVHNETAYYFCYKPDQQTVLSDSLLGTLRHRGEQYVIYADVCALSDDDLKRWNITFKKIPRDIIRF